MNIMEEVEKEYLKKKAPDFKVGDTVRVYVKVMEASKERLQVFEGQVIGRRGRGINSSFTVRKVSLGEGVERVFLLNSPKIARIEVVKREAVRRAKLYYTRRSSGRKVK